MCEYLNTIQIYARSHNTSKHSTDNMYMSMNTVSYEYESKPNLY